MAFQILGGDAQFIVPGASLRLTGTLFAPFDAADYENALPTLQNTDGQILATGTLDGYVIDEGFNPEEDDGVLVRLSGTLDIPATVPASEAGELAYIVWTARFDGEDTRSVEPVSIYQATGIKYGLVNSVGFEEFSIKGILKVPDNHTVSVEVYAPLPSDEKLATIAPQVTRATSERALVEDTFTIDNVWMIVNGMSETTVYNPVFHAMNPTYTTAQDSTVRGYDRTRSYQVEQAASLDPYTLQWYIVNSASRRIHVGSSLSWQINNSISQAMHEMALAMERNIAVPGLLQDAFSNTDYMLFLKMGRDYFNMLERTPSQFTMIAADGHLRMAWLLCAEYHAAMSKQLQEALKAFDFSGASTTLSVDLATAYETYKSGLESLIDSTVKPYKRQLVIRNILSGDGATSELVGSPSLTQGWTDSTLLRRGRIQAWNTPTTSIF